MEGVLALGTVSSLITIVDRGIELISDIKEVYRAETGASAWHARIDGTAKELKSNCDQAARFLDHDDDDDPLITRANNAAEKLQKIFADLQAGPRKRDAVVKTIKSRWKRNEIEELQHEVQECRQLLQARLVVLMAGKALSSQNAPGSPGTTSTPKMDRKEMANMMKNALWYPELHLREEKIVKAHNKTFQWIFEDPDPDAQHPWNSFKDWLENGEGIYWVNGKAGSGKSTLINFVKDEDRTLQGLEGWAQLSNLVVASFFFWNSGSPLERSLEGLYRSLVSQILEKTPQTVEIMFTPQELEQVRHLILPAGRDTYWSERKLARALQRLAAASTRFESFCFFIDGLDEFDGDHDLLVDVLEEIASAKHIKIVTSSRPLPIFSEAFADYPTLRLQDLTAGDLRLYIHDELVGFRKGRKFADGKSEEFKALVDDVVHKAQGVFLWVYLVVRSLQKGIRNGDNTDDLKARVDDSPEDLLDLFGKMVARLEPRYKAQSSQIFRILFASPEKDKAEPKHSPALSILDLILACEDNIVVKASVPVTGVQWPTILERVSDFEERIATICCGLLEFSSAKGKTHGEWLETITPQVSTIIRKSPQLLHQSVSEFLGEQKVVSDFSIVPQETDYEKLLAGRIVAVKFMLRPGLSNEDIHNLADYAFALALHVEKKTGKSNASLIDQLWRSCSACATPHPGRETWLSVKNKMGKSIARATSVNILRDDDGDDSEAARGLDQIDLLAYTIISGFYVYAHHHIERNPAPARAENLIPLLDAMVLLGHDRLFTTGQLANSFDSGSEMQLLSLLFENGADPNKKWSGRSPWSRRVQNTAEEACMSEIGSVPKDFSLWLKHGADVNAVILYNGLLGPLAEMKSRPSRIEEIEDDSLDDLSVKLAPSDQETSFQELLRSIDIELEKDLGLRERRAAPGGLTGIMFIIGKSIAAETTKNAAKEDFEAFNMGRDTSEESIYSFPTFEISVLQWAEECLIQTEAVKKFSEDLRDKGATKSDPVIVHYTAQRGNLSSLSAKDRAVDSDDVEQMAKDREYNQDYQYVNKWLESEESATFTAAWNKAFPDYIIAGFPREIYRMLGLINQRVDAPGTLGARHSMPVSIVAKGFFEMLASGLVPTTGIRVDGVELDKTTEGCARILGALEIILKFGNRLDEVGGLGGLMGIAGPEELKRDCFWGESQACNVM